MPRIVGIELYELDLPFRHAFHHAAAERAVSSSLFVGFVTDDGHRGYGETLPRPYVTGEERGATFDFLAGRILPRVLGLGFASFQEVYDFLVRCDGQAPPEWLPSGEAPPRHPAAWCAVDLALLDTFGRAFGTDLARGLPPEIAGAQGGSWPAGLRYGLVLSGEGGPHAWKTLLKARLFGLRDVKVKVEGRSLAGVRLARRVLGRRARLRVDSNMAWSYDEARAAMPLMSREGVESFEQPLAADDLDGLARLCAETGLAVVADESFHDAASLERLIAARACTGVNVRIAKCGGLVAALARSRRALAAGLTLQIGCQVGETSQLSAAQLVLVHTLGRGVSTLEGCYGERLLETDPVRPLLQFRRRGLPPRGPGGTGLGTEVDLTVIQRHAGRRLSLGATGPSFTQEPR
jgi:L-alanine-DL-glutamate epimerase-like enolase superfamily enzyme